MQGEVRIYCYDHSTGENKEYRRHYSITAGRSKFIEEVKLSHPLDTITIDIIPTVVNVFNIIKAEHKKPDGYDLKVCIGKLFSLHAAMVNGIITDRNYKKKLHQAASPEYPTLHVMKGAKNNRTKTRASQGKF